jgi:hypothetical protein
MKLSVKTKRWRCGRKGCWKEKGMKVGSIFEGSKIKVSVCVRLMLYWYHNIPITTAIEWTGMAKSTVSDWYDKCRDICQKEMSHCPMQEVFGMFYPIISAILISIMYIGWRCRKNCRNG